MRDVTKLVKGGIRINYEFQSTHPVRDVTLAKSKMSIKFDISIHTSREGCDLPLLQEYAWDFEFQSTHPVRDVTRKQSA